MGLDMVHFSPPPWFLITGCYTPGRRGTGRCRLASRSFPAERRPLLCKQVLHRTLLEVSKDIEGSYNWLIIAVGKDRNVILFD